MTYIAFVPARSGSKRVPGKNVRKLAGLPLFVHTLRAFEDSSRIDKVIFSTDSEQYWEMAQSYSSSGKLSLDFRSTDEAGDRVKIFDYLKGSFRKIFADDEAVFLMGLPTVPLRTRKHVDEALDLHEQTGKAVFSATEYEFPVSFAFYLNADQTWAPLLDGNPMVTGNTRSQDQRQAFHPNGAIYVRPVADFANPELATLYEDAVPYLMDRKDSIDIDNEIDFRIAESMFRGP